MSQGIRMPAAFLALRRRAVPEPVGQEGVDAGPDAGSGPSKASPAISAAEPTPEPAAAQTDTLRVQISEPQAKDPNVLARPAGTSAGSVNSSAVAVIGVDDLPDDMESTIAPESGRRGSDSVNDSNASNTTQDSRSQTDFDDGDLRTAGKSLTALELRSRTDSRRPSAKDAAREDSELVLVLPSPTASLPLKDSEIDRYGFKTASQFISKEAYNRWWESYEPYLARRRAKWVRLLEDHGLPSEDPVRFPPRSTTLKRYIRKGIPADFRGAAWWYFARGQDKLNAHQDLYARLVEDSRGLHNSDTEHIERDLHRTFPDNALFRPDPSTGAESANVQRLRRLLVAFSTYQPKIGYCQSLNFLAGTLLLFLEEEKAFWMLVIITQNYLVGLHEVNLEQVNISQGVLMVNVRDRLPKVWDSFALEASLQDNFVSNLPPISLCTASWFMSMFVSILPTETMLRVWDVFFFEGPTVLYRIALTLLKLVEPQLSAMSDDMEVFQCIQTFPKTLLDPTLLLGTCFKRVNGFGHVSQNDISAIQHFVSSRRSAGGNGVSGTDREEYARLRPRQRLRARLHLYS